MNYPNKIPPICQPGEGGILSRNMPYTTYIDYARAKYGSEVYPIDRFAEVFHIEENVWALRLASPSYIGSNWAYLIEGPEKALLIDTGYGVGNHKGLCEQLVPGKEILCALTHFHLDHAYGAHQWEEVYCHDFTADILEYKLASGGACFDYVRKLPRDRDNDDSVVIREIYTEEDIIPYRPFKCIHLQNHDVINLGEDYDIELIHMGCHTPGLSCYLDKKGRRLYTGDAIFETLQQGLGIGLDLRSTEDIPHSEYLNIYYFYDQIKALAERLDEFDLTADGHGSIDSDKRVVSDLRDAIAAVMEDPYSYTDKIETVFGVGYIMQKGIANCRYSDPATVLELPKKS